jgi:hypothetical protein
VRSSFDGLLSRFRSPPARRNTGCGNVSDPFSPA